jgi:RHS repeat-associated protein
VLLPSAASASRLFTSGFELDSVTAGVEWATLNNNGTIRNSTTHTRTGVYALEVTAPTANVATTVGYTFANTAGNGPYYARFYLYIASMPTGADDEIASFKNLANSTTEAFLRLQTNGQVALINSNGGATIGSASAALNTGQWYRVEMKFDKTGGAGASTLEWKLDGVVQATASNLTLGAGVLAFHVGTNTAGGATTGVDLYYDDVAINDGSGGSQNNYPNAGNEILYVPKAAGDSNTMHTSTGATGTSNNFSSTKEVPPDDATSFLQGTTTAAGTDYYTTGATSTSITLPANSTAQVVQVYSRYTGGSSSANSTFKMQLKNASGGTASTSVGITPSSTTWLTSSTTAPFVFYTDPTGATWTNTNLATFQIGEQISGANTNAAKVSSVWAYIDYSTATSSSSRAVSQNISFTYDAVGNITKIVDNSQSDAAATTTYTYDDLYRLTSASSTSAASGGDFLKTYAYDLLGNITSSSDKGTYTYAGNTGTSYADPDAVTSIGGTATSTYDNDGNLLTYKAAGIATSTYTWDNRNRMTQSVVAGTTTTYGYDINDERVQLGSTIYPFTFYNTQGASSTITKHIFANGEPIADLQGSGASTSVYYLHGDNLNSINVVSDSSANVDQLYAYYAYGAQRITEKNGSFTEQRQFIGDEYDASGLNYMNARYYNASQGQFISEDPMFWGKQHLNDPQKLNAYGYGRDNPITLLDTNGWDSAYFAAKSVGNGFSWGRVPTIQDFTGAVGGEHNYVYFNIDSNAGLSELDIPGATAQNGSAEFTISFEPSDSSHPQGSNLEEQLNADLMDAQLNGGSAGHQDINSKDYAQLANDMYLTGDIVTSGKNRYNAWPGHLPGGGYNSNSGLYTIANLNGQGAAYNQFQHTLATPGLLGGKPYGNTSIPIGNSIGAFVGTYNFGSDVGTYNFGTHSWNTSASTPTTVSKK